MPVSGLVGATESCGRGYLLVKYDSRGWQSPASPSPRRLLAVSDLDEFDANPEHVDLFGGLVCREGNEFVVAQAL